MSDCLMIRWLLDEKVEEGEEREREREKKGEMDAIAKRLRNLWNTWHQWIVHVEEIEWARLIGSP